MGLVALALMAVTAALVYLVQRRRAPASLWRAQPTA
jgi:hypothetical protein